MSEPADTFCLNTPTNWKHYRHQICSNWKNNKNNIYNNHRRKTLLTLLNCHNRRRQREKLIIRKQQRGEHHHPGFFTFPLHLKLNFARLGTGINSSHKTGHKGVAKAYFCSVKKRSVSDAGSNTGIDIYKLKQKMANTLSVMTNVLRNVVSKQRIRYKEKGFNLDLAYVSDNIIAMGYPAEKYESMYRNRLEDVYKFLEENHGDHYKIYNLCLERSYDINKFHGRVSVYPFEDHNPPTIELIQKFCEDVDSWLKADALNVAAVHCKAGKGRTGTMICCYLIYCGQQRTADDALSCYDEKRTKDRKGVTIPSQRRYVQYFSKLMRLGLPYERRTLQLCEIRFSEANLLHSHGTVHCSISVLQDIGCTVKVQPLQNLTIDFRKHCVLDIKNPPLTVAGDIKVELTKNNKKIFHFWFNTFFVTDSSNSVTEGAGNEVKFVYTLHKCEIDDAHKDKEHKNFSEDFKVNLVFYIDDNITGLDHTQVSGSNRLTSNHHRSTPQCAPASVRLPPPNTQSNTYSLPQNNSSGSEMNFLCDQKSSSSTSVSSSLGGGGTTDNSNGYESNTQQRTAQLRSSGAAPQQQFSNSHHSHPYAAMQDANSVRFISPQLAPQPPVMSTSTQKAPPGFMMEFHHQQPQHLHKDNTHHLQQVIKETSVTAGSASNQRHMQRQSASGGAGGSGVIQGVIQATNMDVMCRQPSGNMNVTSNNTNYNHSTNSSKASSVSSQSSSAIGDNEEDWESANPTTTIDNAMQMITTTAAATETIKSLINTSIDVIQQRPPLPSPPTPPPRQLQSKAANSGSKFRIGRTANKSKYNHQRNSKQQKCNGLKKDNEGDIDVVQNSSNNIKNTTPTTTSTGASNNSTASKQELCHSCLPAGDLTSELQCC